MTIRTLPTLAISGLIGAASSAAFGQTNDEALSHADPTWGGAETRSQVIGYSDLDLSNPQGASTLIGRINGAAERVCAPSPAFGASFQERADYQRCVQQANGQAVNGLGNRTVTYAYRRRHPDER